MNMRPYLTLTRNSICGRHAALGATARQVHCDGRHPQLCGYTPQLGLQNTVLWEIQRRKKYMICLPLGFIN